jgi:hypothetical protein
MRASAAQQELIHVRRDANAPKMVRAWASRAREEWVKVAVPFKVRSSEEAKKAFERVVRGGIFKYGDISLKDLVIADPIKVNGIWYGFIDGYSFPLSLVIEDGGDVVYHVDVWF